MVFGHTLYLITGLFTFQSFQLSAQETLVLPRETRSDIFALMERTDLPLREVERLAKIHFEKTGTGRGTGYKIFMRWLYERQFHVDAKGYFIRPETESRAYQAFMAGQARQPRTTTPWQSLGPTTSDPSSGWNPGIGRITSVAIHPANESIIYVSSPGGGIWKSTNAGVTWTPLIDQANSAWMEIFHLAIDPNNPNTLYACVMNGGVIKSTNAGATWSSTGGGPSNARKVIIDPTNSNVLLCASTLGIHRSANGGSSWTYVINWNDGIGTEDLEFKPNDHNVITASGTYSQYLVRSTDNGLTWTVLGTPEGITHTGRTMLAVSPHDPNVVYAVQGNSNMLTFGRMYKSTNSGASFTTTVTGNPAAGTNYFGYSNQGDDNAGQAFYDMAICVNPTNVNEVHIGGCIGWKSTDGGYTFVSETAWYYPNSYGYNHSDLHALEWINSTIYSGSDGGIYKSTNNGGDWTDLSQGLGIRQIYRLSNAVTDANKITIGAQDNGSSYRQTNSNWKDWLGADGMDNVISPTDANYAYGCSQNGNLYMTTNGGISYTDINQPNSPSEWVTPLAMHPTNQSILYGGYTGVFKSENAGSTWTLISGSAINDKMDVLRVAKSNANYIYGSVGPILYRTSNGGSSWTSTTLSADITSIFISTTNPEKIWITLNATSNQVGVSLNSGNTFTWFSAGLPGISARTVVVDEAGDNGVYVGMNIGVYYRDDINTSWVAFGTGLPLVAINELEIQDSAAKIRVATYGRGVWENELVGGAPICGLYFVDSGGYSGNYGNNENWTFTLCPDDPTDKIRLSFLTFAVENGYDFLQIFNGTSTSAPALHPGNGFTGNTSPGVLTSTHSSGCLTARFLSDAIVTDVGWWTAITCINPNCDPEVITTADNIAGSLRYVLANAACSDTIWFNPTLNNKFIDVTAGPLVVNRNLIMAPSTSQLIKIRSVTTGSLLKVNAGFNVTLENLDLYGGNTNSGQSLHNQGLLILKNIKTYPNTGQVGTAILNTGSLTLKGSNEINY